MKRAVCFVVLSFCLVFLVFGVKDVFSQTGSTSEQPGVQKILLIESYGKGEGCGAALESGFVPALEEMGYVDGKNIKLENFHMDTSSVYITDEAKAERARLAIEEIKNFDPDVVVVFDDLAFAKVALPLAKTKYKFVYGGVNVSPEFYNKTTEFMISREKPGHNITGVTEESRSDKAIQLLKTIVPEAKTMVIISSKRGAFWTNIANETVEDINAHPERYPLKLIASHLVDNFEDFKKLVLEYNNRPDVDVIYNYGITELLEAPGATKVIKSQDVVRWLVQNQKKPETTWLMDWVKWGFLCGAGIDLPMSGRQVAIKTIQILKGENPGSIPIDRPMDFYIAINIARAQQLGIEVPFNILSSARIVYSTMSVYPEYQYKK
jgi:ABC-type uncharacterized transport system substrate-binding protein